MERPCTETLRAIIQARAGLLGLELGADVLPPLAEEIHRSPRSLDDLFGRLSALGSRRQGAITVNAVHETLLRRKTGLVSLEHIVEVVSRRLGPFSLAAGDPSGSASHAYRVAVYLAQHLTDRSVEEIARFFGISEPLIVRRLIRMAARRLETDLTLRVLMADLSEEARTLGD
jgi:chromosomal replication initiation ATPase DnaA